MTVYTGRSYHRMCYGKTRRYEDEARRVATERGDEWGHYQCIWCSWWHVGHKPWWMRELEEHEEKAA